MMGEHLDRMDIGVAVHDPARDGRTGVRGGGRRRTHPLHRPAQQQEIKRDPDQHRQGQTDIGARQDRQRPDQSGDGKGHGIEGLEHRIARRGRGLHDPVGDAACKVILEPADGLAQDMAVRPPADDGAEIGQDRIVQKRHVHARKNRPDEEHDQRGKDELGPMRRPDLGRAAAIEKIDEAADIPDQRDLHHRDQRVEDSRHRKDRMKRFCVIHQERQQAPGRRVLFFIGHIGVDEIFEETKHGRGPSKGNMGKGGASRDRHYGIRSGSAERSKHPVSHSAPSIRIAPEIAQTARHVTSGIVPVANLCRSVQFR